MKLSKEQIDIIRLVIDQSHIEIQTLKEDLLDQLCCVIENKMGKKTFEVSLGEALMDLAPNGLDEIQRETVYLLNSSKIFFMKKLIYLIGLITAIAMSLGGTFRILRWHGADELLVYGFLGFAFLFTPMLAVSYFKENLRKALSEKIRIVLGILSGLTVGLAIVFKFLHLQGADFLLLGGALLFSFGFLPFLFFGMYRKTAA
jgi:hypothetical protein